MKRILAMFLLFLMIGGVAMAEMPNYEAMTDEELHTMIDLARNELMRRELVFGEKVMLIDQDGIQVYLTGKYEIKSYSSTVLYLEAVVINNTNMNVTVSNENYKASVNGWDVRAESIAFTNPGKKQKKSFEITISEAEISSFEEIEDIEFNLYAYDTEKYARICEPDPITVHFN